MQFNPTDKSNSLIADIDFFLFGDSSTLNTEYSITDRTRNINNAWDEAITELYKADPNYQWDDTSNSDFPIATNTLTSGLDHYDLLDSALVIWRVRVKDQNGKYKTLTPRLRSEFDDDELISTGVPGEYYKLGGSIFPVPIPNYGAASGIEIQFQRGGNHFEITDTTETPGFNPQFHRFLSVSAALDYAMANGMAEKTNMLTGLKEKIRKSMVEHYQTRSPDERPQLRLRRRSIRNYGLSFNQSNDFGNR